MTDNQDPLQALKTLIDNKENVSVATSATSGELTPEQQAAQQQANAEEEAKLQAQLKAHEQQQAVLDQQALENLRTELPQVVTTEASEAKTQDGATEAAATQDLTQGPANEQATQQLIHEVEQLKRLD
ncbi:MAG TPA: hypothetical protein PK302_02660 [Candidatus Woesebacteria bacterium]|nr:hypothetical protein [Candidatus Woesebacteria bacterium]